MYYTINSDSGRISSVGISDDFGGKANGTEPFTLMDAFNYRFNSETENWIYDPIMIVPQEITKLQAVKRLLDTGRYIDLMTAIDSDHTGESRILFDAASTLARDSNMVSQFATALGFSDEDTDEFFVEADKIMV